MSSPKEIPSFSDHAGVLIPRIESALDAATRFDADCPPKLAEAIRYSVLAPGKRLRPAMTLWAAQAVGGEESAVVDAAMPAAVAVEMIHAYSLIHDDLPAMDDDDLRRGRPTTHIQFDESTAILAGDALQAEAFSHLVRGIASPEIAKQAVLILARASGASCLVGGQMDDLDAESMSSDSPKTQSMSSDSPKTQSMSSDPSETHSTPPETGLGDVSGAQSTRLRSRSIEFLEAIHRRKTGALFSAAINLGSLIGSNCVSGGGREEQRRELDLYSSALGLAFQVVDDLLDATAADATLGKRSGKDLERGKLTYVGLLGIDDARVKAAQLVSEAKVHLDPFGNAADPLRALADYVLERSH